MPVIKKRESVKAAVLQAQGWRRMIRIDTPGGNVSDVANQTASLHPEKLVFAEGDSWLDKFTPFGTEGTNLLDTIRTPFHTAVVDVSRIGSQAREMVSGQQARQTRAMFKLFDFDAILLSAGGNDLKNVFAALFEEKALMREGVTPIAPRAEVKELEAPGQLTHLIDEVVGHIVRFVDLRNASRQERTQNAPIFVHGYDYLQPRPAGARIFAGLSLGTGPWLFPAMAAAGLSDAQMLKAAVDVIDALNTRLQAALAPLPNVFVIDQRGLLTPARPGSEGDDKDWLDEIHPNESGFVKLARQYWDVPLARALGWPALAADLN